MAPVLGWAVPAAHGTHAVPLDAVPTGHCVHCDALTELTEPDAQAVHATAEAADQVLAGQAAHCWALAFAKEPAAQGMQLELLAGATLPGAQAVQDVAAALLKKPGEQPVQPPSFGEARKEPAAQAAVALAPGSV